MGIDFMTETGERRCRQMDRCELILAETREKQEKKQIKTETADGEETSEG